MEGAVREVDFSSAEVERIARDPSIRWWRDASNDVIWEMRAVLRLLPSAARELTFSHVTLGARSVVIAEDLRLGELSDGAITARQEHGLDRLDARGTLKRVRFAYSRPTFPSGGRRFGPCTGRSGPRAR
jgi:hypothetical protein